MNSMYKAVKEQWVAALRSGEYKQGRNALKRNDSYCCLGVLCELAVKSGVIPEPWQNGYGTWSYGNEYHSSTSTLPFAVREWAGIHKSNPLVDIEGKNFGDVGVFDDPDRPSLAAMNDSGVAFESIANLIEEQL